MSVFASTVLLSCLMPSAALPETLRCDMTQYKEQPGLTAVVERDVLTVTWLGQDGAELRARYAIESGRPWVRELAIRKKDGPWSVLGRDFSPEYHVVSGMRRMQAGDAKVMNKELGIEITQEVIDKGRWVAFHDAPLEVPPRPMQSVLELPRKPEEIRRASATFRTTECSVKTDGARLEVMFPGLSLGIFAGSLQFTVYRGANLIRMDAIAKTDEPKVAYKFDAGLRGFATDLTPRVAWLDVGGNPQQYQFGGPKNETIVPLKAKNRVLIAEGPKGSVAAFPMPHKYFWAREIHVNLGYVWYRKDADRHFAMGVRQAEREESTKPGEIDCFALFNAPPGTWQRMGMYFYLSHEPFEPTRQAVLAFTHGDTYRPLPGFKTFANHWHIHFTEALRESGSLDTPQPELTAMKALGLNIVGLSDFHGDLHGNDSGALRFQDQKDYAEGCRRASDKDFLVLPWEEPNFPYFGGHSNIMLPKNVYFTKVRREGQPFIEMHPVFGKVYHLGSADDVQRMLDAENGYWNTSHPRTKSSAGYPDGYWHKPFARNERYLGTDFSMAMGMDLSEKRASEWRSFDAVDTMNNLYVNSGLRPKNLIADIDTYEQGPEDDLYSGYQVSYLRLDRVPGPNDDWSPILRALREGEFFVTTGEVLVPSFAVEGSGDQRTIVAEVEWTFPLEFVEVVWGDGQKIDRQVVSATDLPPFGRKRLSIPLNAAGKSWVRFAVWDSAGNPGFVNAVWLKGGS